MRNLPEQLKNPNYRFFFANKDSKNPYEKSWNSGEFYMFFEPKLNTHLFLNCNIGICTGIGSLIVLDFDDKEYQELKVPQLPQTFTVITAKKRLKHLYYHLQGEMISGVGIDKYYLKGIRISLEDYLMIKEENSRDDLKKLIQSGKLVITRMMDIQARGTGVCCPPSVIGNKIYSIVNDYNITEINCQQLSEVFIGIEFSVGKKKQYKNNFILNPKSIQDTINILAKLNIRRTGKRHYMCPLHSSKGNKNLFVMDDGALYCFNCMHYWRDGYTFYRELKND